MLRVADFKKVQVAEVSRSLVQIALDFDPDGKEACIQAFFSVYRLNPHSLYHTPFSTALSGIGVSVSLASVGNNSRPVIAAIVPRGPADLDGTLQEGDYLVRCACHHRSKSYIIFEIY
jgi:hypothetical protein